MKTTRTDEGGQPRLKISLEIDREVYAALREVSQSCGLSMTNYVRSLLYTHLDSRRNNTENTK